MKVFFDKLYYRYYKFQERIGNRDVAPFTSSLIIAFVIVLYYFSLLFLLMLLFTKEKVQINMSVLKTMSVILVPSLIVGFPAVYLYRRRYKEVLNRYNDDNTSGLIAMLFPLISFVLFNAGWILKMLQNQGYL